MKLDDTIKFAVLMRCVTGQLKTWLQLNVAETQDYSRLREAIIQYDSATLKWNNAMMLGQEVNKDGAVPMEVDRIMEKGKFGKGKGEENPKGKGKGEQKGGKQGGKGKGQQKGQDHGGGGKGQQKGSWKQESLTTCEGVLRMWQTRPSSPRLLEKGETCGGQPRLTK